MHKITNIHSKPSDKLRHKRGMSITLISFIKFHDIIFFKVTRYYLSDPIS